MSQQISSRLLSIFKEKTEIVAHIVFAEQFACVFLFRTRSACVEIFPSQLSGCSEQPPIEKRVNQQATTKSCSRQRTAACNHCASERLPDSGREVFATDLRYRMRNHPAVGRLPQSSPPAESTLRGNLALTKGQKINGFHKIKPNQVVFPSTNYIVILYIKRTKLKARSRKDFENAISLVSVRNLATDWQARTLTDNTCLRTSYLSRLLMYRCRLLFSSKVPV